MPDEKRPVNVQIDWFENELRPPVVVFDRGRLIDIVYEVPGIDWANVNTKSQVTPSADNHIDKFPLRSLRKITPRVKESHTND